MSKSGLYVYNVTTVQYTFNRAQKNSSKLRLNSLHSPFLQSFVNMETSMLNKLCKCYREHHWTSGSVVILVAVANDALSMQL